MFLLSATGHMLLSEWPTRSLKSLRACQKPDLNWARVPILLSWQFFRVGLDKSLLLLPCGLRISFLTASASATVPSWDVWGATTVEEFASCSAALSRQWLLERRGGPLAGMSHVARNCGHSMSRCSRYIGSIFASMWKWAMEATIK